MKIKNYVIAVVLLFAMILSVIPSFTFASDETVIPTNYTAGEFGSLFDMSNKFVVVKNKQMGGSHYAYTEGVSDEVNGVMGSELNFEPGSQMVLLTLAEESGKIVRKEEVLLESKGGVIRDPDVSADGLTVLFSWKKSRTDDYHLYTFHLGSKTVTQLTFGIGIADIEPKYLPSGKIIFSSTRCIEYVDCWVTPVSNMYTCNADGSDIMRLGYDQVHTTYPTITADGRVLYTRWDYNDRTQMYVQGMFQMFPDGTNQTEVFGNNSSFPTTLLHSRDVPGVSGLYVSISSGHHTYQAGKMVLVDTSKGRNEAGAVTFVFPDSQSSKRNEEDGQNQSGPLYKYPVAINSEEFLVSYCKNGWSENRRETPFGIYYMNSKTGKRLLISEATSSYGASQIAVIKNRTMFERPSMVNHKVETGTYYVGNVYKGEMEGIEEGTAKYLRVIALEFRSSSIGATIASGVGSADQFSPVATGNGAWDVKRVLGIIPVEEDGSAMFQVPANTPIYFQVLNDEGEIIQSMRSWSTLMPNEIFSCVGCHEDKNTAPPAAGTTTMAMKKGVQKLQPDIWMDVENPDIYNPITDSKGFSFLEQVQPILDRSCIKCHNNVPEALFKTKAQLVDDSDANTVLRENAILPEASKDWKYNTSANAGDGWKDESFDASSWKTGAAPFGTFRQKTEWKTGKIYIRNTFRVTNVNELKEKDIILKVFYDENPEVYLNGELIYSAEGYLTEYNMAKVTDAFLANVKDGENVIAASAINTSGGQILDLGIYSMEKDTSDTANNPVSFEGSKVLGDREKMYYTLSYLVLTGSESRGNQFVGNPDNDYTNWISSMSKEAPLNPYESGSSKSPLIEKLRSGHGDLTEEEIRTFNTWIDLGVPFRGSYDEANNWTSREYQEYYEKLNKRNHYTMADQAVKNPVSEELTISCKGESTTGTGWVTLNLSKKLAANDTISVELPEGVDYFFLNINPRLPETLIYCPDSVYEFKLFAGLKNVYPSSVFSDSSPVISAKVASEAELKTSRNLAVNAYDYTNNDSSYPHATASDTYNNDKSPEFSARNAIDGFKINEGHGNYPVQSWGPNNVNEKLWYQVDFGNEVFVNNVAITIRADFPHDTNFTKGVLEFSDGTTQEIEIDKTKETQVFQIEANDGVIKTSYVKIRDLEKDSSEWASLTEVEVFGTVKEVLAPKIEKLEIVGDVSLDKEFSPDVYEYKITPASKDIFFTIRGIEASNTSVISMKVNDNDIPYDNEMGLTLEASKVKSVKIILSGPGGSTVYTLKVDSEASAIWLIVGICAG